MTENRVYTLPSPANGVEQYYAFIDGTLYNARTLAKAARIANSTATRRMQAAHRGEMEIEELLVSKKRSNRRISAMKPKDAWSHLYSFDQQLMWLAFIAPWGRR